MTVETISNELHRLQISADDCPLSGLMVEQAANGLKLYDDYDSGVYDPGQLLSALTSLTPDTVSVDGDSPSNIWQLISDCEISPF